PALPTHEPVKRLPVILALGSVVSITSPSPTVVSLSTGRSPQFSGDNVLYGKQGWAILPGRGQQVISTWWDRTVLSDTTVGDGLVIDTIDPSARITGNRFTGSWVGSAGGAGVQVRNGASDTVTRTLFQNFQAYEIA